MGKLLARLAASCAALFEKRYDTCARCAGHGCIEVYDISDEYAVPCPRCRPDQFRKSANRRGWSTDSIERDLTEAGRSALGELKS